MNFSSPRIIANFAISADGRISLPSKESSDFTSKKDKNRLWEIRGKCDAIFIGRLTLEKERTTLKSPQGALRCVISRLGEFPLSHPLWESGTSPIHLFVKEKHSCQIKLQQKFPHIHLHQMDLKETLIFMLENLHISILLCEGGGMLFRSLCELQIVEEIYLTLSTQIFGNQKMPTITGLCSEAFSSPTSFSLVEFKTDGEESFLHYKKN